MANFKNITIKDIDNKDTYDFILNKHYAKRKPSISYAFGMFINENELIGILTIGKPASNSLCKGICGEKYSKNVFELNRLCVIDGLEKNILSYFVSKCLRLLKNKDLIIVSYADEGMNHNGYIYQATNFIYTGKTKSRTDKYVPNGKHSRHYNDEFDHLRKVRTPKHRYVYFTSKKIKKECLCKLNYKIQQYPKGENKKYVLGEKIKNKVINTITNEIFYE